MNYKIDISDIEIEIKLAKKPGNVLAQATLIILDQFEIHGFTISRSQIMHESIQEKIWIQPPKTRAGVFWKKTAWCRDSELWSQIELKMYDKYHLLRTKYPTDYEYVDPNEIPENL